MRLEKSNEHIELEDKEYYIGMDIVGTNESEYEGLKGRIIEIRTGEDKDTENEGPDIYCCFEEPTEPDEIKRLEEVFSDLYDEPKSIDEICLDSVIMAPSMIKEAVTADNLKHRIFGVIEKALAISGFKILDGDHDSVIIRHGESDTDFEIKINEIAG